MSKTTPDEIILMMRKARGIKLEQFEEILDKHKKWLRFEHEGERADLTCAYFVFGYVNLKDAILTNAILPLAMLKGALLVRANLRNADLRGVDLSGADLTDADLTGADLEGANLEGANLTGANLTDANLENTRGTYGVA